MFSNSGVIMLVALLLVLLSGRISARKALA